MTCASVLPPDARAPTPTRCGNDLCLSCSPRLRPRNLRPQPRPSADRIDRTENELNDAVCSGRLGLAEAQLRESALKHGG